MADIFTSSPRRVAAMIRLHPAEVAAIVTQRDILAAFTLEELMRIHAEVSDELKVRSDHE